MSWHALGELLAEQGHREEAREVLSRARSIFEVTVGHHHSLFHRAGAALCTVERQRGARDERSMPCAEIGDTLDRRGVARP